MTKIINRITSMQVDKEVMIVLVIFGLNLYLAFNVFFPSLRAINFWDESVYVNTGRMLVQGELPSFARNPLIGVLYGLIYLPFIKSPLWLIQSVSLGRMILFGLMWWSCYLVARQLFKQVNAIAIAGCLLVFPVLTEILLNPSDALFAAVSGFTFWQVLSFYNTRWVKHIWLGSLFVGLAALSRNDGLVLFLIFLFLMGWVSFQAGQKFSWLVPAVVPFILLIGGYLLLYRAVTGTYGFDTQERSYVAFEQGQSVDYQKDPACAQKQMTCAVLQTRQLYGSGPENGYSVFRAILRNPGAYLSRVKQEMSALPQMFYDVFGKRTALFLFILAGRGLLELVRRKQYTLLGLLVLWPAYLGVYLLTFFRIGYLRTPYFIVYALGILGAAAFVADTQNRKAFLAWFVALAAALVASSAADVRTVSFTVTVLLAALLLIRLAHGFFENPVAASALGMLLVFGAALILMPPSEPPARTDVAAGEEEQAVILIQKILPLNSVVAAGAPGGVWAARMYFQDVKDDTFVSANSPQALYAALKKKGVQAVFVEPSLSNANVSVWKMIEAGIGTWYDTAYFGRDGSVRVLLLK